jgi:ElaA protein
MQFLTKEFNQLSTKELYEILKVRSEIFIVEQKMNCLDMDYVDYDCLHCYIMENENIVAYLRAYKTENYSVKIGRVLTTTHGIGLGKELMLRSIIEIKKYFSCEKIELHSQISAVGFYEKLGFKAIGERFLEENVWHISMVLE